MTELAFFKNTLDKLEIELQIFYAGKYKSATEPFRLDSISAANEEQLEAFLFGAWDHFLGQISASRNIDISTLDSIAGNMVVRNTSAAKQTGLVDELLYQDKLLAEFKERLGLEEDEDVEMISINKYDKAADKDYKIGVDDHIAVVYAQGSISGGSDEENIQSGLYAKTLREIREDDKVKAMVLRVNSPGGSALASDVILREVQLASEMMPVVVSMGNLAASGGYYISCAADTIVAEPTTLTGSIGVFGILPNFEQFFNNKLGITFDNVKTGEFADFGTGTKPLSRADSMVVQAFIDTIYRDFKSRVAEGRDMSMEAVEAVAQGRIWTGVQAKEKGLVDVIGSLDDAIELAAGMAGLEGYKRKEFPKQKDPFEELMKELTGEVKVRWLKRELGENYSYYERVKGLQDFHGIQARLPFELNIR